MHTQQARKVTNIAEKTYDLTKQTDLLANFGALLSNGNGALARRKA